MKKYETTVKDAQKRVNVFNELYAIGSQVKWRFVCTDKDFKTYTTRSKAFEQNGQALVFLNGKNGYVSIDKQFLKYPKTNQK